VAGLRRVGRRERLALAALAVGQVAYGRGSRSPAATRAVAGLMLATAALEARAAGDGRAMAAAGAVGFGAELVGVRTGHPFGHYAYSDQLGPRVGGVPLLAAGAWAMLARPAWVTAGLLAGRRARSPRGPSDPARPPGARRRRAAPRLAARSRREGATRGRARSRGLPAAAARVVVAAGALTAWDVFLDPRMAREGYWSWPGGGRYEGVPASNFAGWFVTGLAVFAAYAALARGEASDEALALYVWTWLGEVFANAALWGRPRVALAGGVAMGVFAAPALVGRIRG
jgi:uncharacterized membrane protein